MVMETFFDTYDFIGKTIIQYNAYLGSGNGGTYIDVAELEPNAKVVNGIAFSVNDVDEAEKNPRVVIRSWILTKWKI